MHPGALPASPAASRRGVAYQGNQVHRARPRRCWKMGLRPPLRRSTLDPGAPATTLAGECWRRLLGGVRRSTLRRCWKQQLGGVRGRNAMPRVQPSGGSGQGRAAHTWDTRAGRRRGPQARIDLAAVNAACSFPMKRCLAQLCDVAWSEKASSGSGASPSFVRHSSPFQRISKKIAAPES